jgi:glycosyltransferase involved in cell wall biosynthesis
MRLLITSHVIHYSYEGRLYAYGPYAREIDLWADLFASVVIASPCVNGKPPADCLPFERNNISMHPQKRAGGESFGAKLRLLASIPAMALGLARAMRQADAVHVRCPGNLGLLGVLLAPLFSRRLVAKYAAQWNGGDYEPFSARLQRAILRTRWWRGPVTVYGSWPGSPKHVISFFTSLLTADQLERARASARRERRGPVLRVLYTGRLSKAKNVDVLLEAVAKVRRAGYEVETTVVGVGPERSHLEGMAASLGLKESTRFTGGLEFDRVIAHLESSDVLVLASETEGWPKSIAEGMAFGLACIGSNVGIVPQMLGEGRGFTVTPRDTSALSSILEKIAASPDRLQETRLRAAAWAQRYSLEGLKKAIRALLIEWWPDSASQLSAGGQTPPQAAPAVHTGACDPIGVVHMVDALKIGGAERVAINLVNLLPRDRYVPYLCATRSEGPMTSLVSPHVTRLCLDRRGLIDASALRRFVRFISDRKIRIVHAHGSSLFFGRLAAALSGKCALIWHDHYGRSDFNDRSTFLYGMAARGAAGVIVVNQTLFDWCHTQLGVGEDHVWYVPNIVPDVETSPADSAEIELPGEPGKRLACVANFRPQKDHPTLLRAMALVDKEMPGSHLFLIGDSSEPDYVARIRAQISSLNLDHAITYLGPRQDVAAILGACDIGVLSSASEGLPLALLEYGRAGLAAVATAVGQCSEVLEQGRSGMLVQPGSPEELARAIVSLVQSEDRRAAYGERFRSRVEECYSPRRVMRQICDVYETVLREAV